jgi:hypothetical protein
MLRCIVLRSSLDASGESRMPRKRLVTVGSLALRCWASEECRFLDILYVLFYNARLDTLYILQHINIRHMFVIVSVVYAAAFT